jgi:hypothetical protein
MRTYKHVNGLKTWARLVGVELKTSRLSGCPGKLTLPRFAEDKTGKIDHEAGMLSYRAFQSTSIVRSNWQSEIVAYLNTYHQSHWS